MIKKLPEVCRIQYGFAFDSNQFSTEDGIPLVRIRDVVRGYSETYTTEMCAEDYVVNNGDILIGMDGEFNIARWNGGKAWLNQRVCKLIPSDQIDDGYLFYFMPTALKTIEAKTPFVTVKHLSAKELNKVKVPMPSLDTQRRVASSLDKVNMLIASRKQQLAGLDALIKARFVEMFGDTEINPLMWAEVRIGDIIECIEAGWSGNGKQREQKPGEIAVLKVSAVTKGYFIPEECKVLDDQDNIKKYVYPHKGDLLFSRANTREMVGATAIISSDYPDLLLPDKLWRVCFTANADVTYMKFVLSSKSIREQFSAASTGTSGSMFNVSMDKFESIVIPLPPLEVQNQFSVFVAQVDKSKVVVQKALDEAQLLFDSLMQKYFG